MKYCYTNVVYQLSEFVPIFHSVLPKEQVPDYNVCI